MTAQIATQSKPNEVENQSKDPESPSTSRNARTIPTRKSARKAQVHHGACKWPQWPRYQMPWPQNSYQGAWASTNTVRRTILRRRSRGCQSEETSEPDGRICGDQCTEGVDYWGHARLETRAVLVHALTSSQSLHETLDLFLTREAAEAELREILQDEPDWKDVLRVVPIELDGRNLSEN
jgi:hypothetical protein